MFIAHLPAGYVLSTSLHRLHERRDRSATLFTLAGMAGAITPDIDLFYFYLIDDRQHHHHTYFTHLPIFWCLLILFFFGIRRWVFRHSFWPSLGLIFAINGFGHLVLDAIVGDIWWFAPWLDQPFSLYTVARRWEPWWINFILNPSFALEIVLTLAALVVWRRRRRLRRR